MTSQYPAQAGAWLLRGKVTDSVINRAEVEHYLKDLDQPAMPPIQVRDVC